MCLFRPVVNFIRYLTGSLQLWGESSLHESIDSYKVQTVLSTTPKKDTVLCSKLGMCDWTWHEFHRVWAACMLHVICCPDSGTCTSVIPPSKKKKKNVQKRRDSLAIYKPNEVYRQSVAPVAMMLTQHVWVVVGLPWKSRHSESFGDPELYVTRSSPYFADISTLRERERERERERPKVNRNYICDIQWSLS